MFATDAMNHNKGDFSLPQSSSFTEVGHLDVKCWLRGESNDLPHQAVPSRCDVTHQMRSHFNINLESTGTDKTVHILRGIQGMSCRFGFKAPIYVS